MPEQKQNQPEQEDGLTHDELDVVAGGGVIPDCTIDPVFPPILVEPCFPVFPGSDLVS